MRTTALLSVALSSVVVLGNPMFPSGGGGGRSYPEQTSGGQSGYGYTANGAAQAPPGSGPQRGSTTNQAQGYADSHGESANLDDGKRISQNVFGSTQNQQVPTYNVRAGPHDSSQGPSYVTTQVPADPRVYQPPPKNAGPYGAGTVAAHIPTAPTPGGTQQADPSRGIITQPPPGSVANQDRGKTSGYNQDNPNPRYRKRDLDEAVVMRRELVRRGLAIRELLERELASSGYWGWEY